MTKSGCDRRKKNVLRRCLNIASAGADVTCSGRLFRWRDTGNRKSPFADGVPHTVLVGTVRMVLAIRHYLVHRESVVSVKFDLC